MKKLNKLFAILIAVLGVGTLSAQTDVTSQYLTNAGFETDGSQSSTKVPTGWTLGAISGGYTSYRPINNAKTPNGEYVVSNGATSGAAEGSCYLYMRTNWGSSVCELKQTTLAKLPIGKYTLKADVLIPFSRNTGLHSFVLQANVGSTTSSSEVVQFQAPIWRTIEVDFEVTSESTMTISLYHNDKTGGCTPGLMTLVDNVRLIQYNYTSLTNLITEAEDIYDANGTGASEFQGCINTAKQVAQTASIAEVNSAIETLEKAIKTYQKAQFVVPASTDYTSWISNANLNTTTGGTVVMSGGSVWNSNIPKYWNIARTVDGGMNTTTINGQSGKGFETWCSNATCGMLLYQAVNSLPAGEYTLSVYGCQGGNLFVKSGDNEFKSSQTFSGSKFVQHSVNFIKEKASDAMVVGVQNTATFTQFDEFTLTCVGLNLGELVTQRNALVAELSAYEGKLPQTYYDETVSPALEDANAANTEESLSAANSKLTEIKTFAGTLSPAYLIALSKIEECIQIRDNSTPDDEKAIDGGGTLQTFAEAIETATSDVEKKTAVDDINAVCATLEKARQAYVVVADPNNGVRFDVTFLAKNPSFEDGKNGWTATPSGQMAVNYQAAEFYEDVFDSYQSLSGLADGLYDVQISAFYRTTGSDVAYLYANKKLVVLKALSDESGNIPSGLPGGYNASTGLPNNMQSGSACFGAGLYVNVLENAVVAGGTLKVGVKNNTSTSTDWCMFDDLKIYFKGFDKESAVTALNGQLTTASTLLNSAIAKYAKAPLQGAFDVASSITTANTKNEIKAATANLTNAINLAEASVAPLARMDALIAECREIHDNSYYENEADKSTLNSAIEVAVAALDTLSALQWFENIELALENARQEYVMITYPKGISYNMTFKITNPSFETGDLTGWTVNKSSDTGVKENSNATYATSGVDGNYLFNTYWQGTPLTQKVKGLPSGIYEMKALVASDGATIYLTAGSAHNEGITTSDKNVGLETSIEFVCNNDSVVIGVVGGADGDAAEHKAFVAEGYWWYKADNFRLYRTFDAAKMQSALSALVTEATILKDSKPMGTDFVSKLSAAIDNANIESEDPFKLGKWAAELETVIAEAKVWVITYNEAKAPLVAALERFEADYNDGANGCLYHLQTAAWNTVITEAAEAAEAKDVTDSYAGFETATTELVSALDAAQASIDMYAKLKTEIGYANAYTPIIADNVAGHTATIAAAQNAYDAAEIGDASELILAMQQYKVLDYTYVIESYNKTVALGEWTGSTTTNKGEHWSGNAETTYFDYSHWSGAGTYEATQTITLPAGEYVLMAAGRAADVEGTEAYLKVNDTKVNFAAKGAYGYGIATDGKANFSAEGTYGRSNEGYGWEYRFITFTLGEETEVTLVAGMTIADSRNPLSWAGVCAPVLLTPDITAAQEALQDAIDAAKDVRDNAYPLGEEAFKVSTNSTAYKALDDAITTAQNVYENASAIAALTAAVAPLNEAVNAYKNGYVLNAPAKGARYKIVMNYAGWEHSGKAVTYLAGDRGDQGLYNIKYHAAPNANYAQAFTFTPVADKVNHYTLSMTDVDGNERYVCTGVPYSGNTAQIRTTTEAAKALAVKVIATSTDGIWNLYNTEANQYIGGQDAGFYTVNSHTTFRLQEAAKAEVTLSISTAKWATLILPFNAALPEGVKAYSCGEVAEDGETLTLVVAESLVANTPYLVSGAEGSYSFSGYGLADKDSYTDGLFTGTYADINAPVGSYVLQKNNGILGFYRVGETVQPTVKAYRSYMNYEGAKAPMFRIGEDEETTSIDNAQSAIDNAPVIYDLMGRKVTNMMKGNMYIVNGKKVVIK